MNTVDKETSVQSPAVAEAQEYVVPEVNIVETRDGYVLEAEMPGVSKDGLDISVEKNVLTIVGRRPADPKATLLYRESPTADFRRVFELDPSIDAARIGARIDQGILTLQLPKAEVVKPRKITVA